jgi:hypothetical protein
MIGLLLVMAAPQDMARVTADAGDPVAIAEKLEAALGADGLYHATGTAFTDPACA